MNDLSLHHHVEAIARGGWERAETQSALREELKRALQEALDAAGRKRAVRLLDLREQSCIADRKGLRELDWSRRGRANTDFARRNFRAFEEKRWQRCFAFFIEAGVAEDHVLGGARDGKLKQK